MACFELQNWPQDLQAWQLLGIYTGQVQFSEHTENLSANADDGIGFLLYDKGEPVILLMIKQLSFQADS